MRPRLWLRAFRSRRSSRQPGQVIVLFAVFLIVLMVLAGSAFDYASIVTEDAKLQNAVDAALSAGADSLARNVAKTPTVATGIAEAATRDYLSRNGFDTAPGTTIQVTFPVSTPAPASTASPIRENLTLSVTRQHQNFFWPLVGINTVDLRGGGGARAARTMTDIMISLDTTASMYHAGFIQSPVRYDFVELREAVDAFIQQVNPNSSDPRGPKIGLARFAGIKCQWVKNGGVPGGDNDDNIDVRAAGTPNEYQSNCTNDQNLLAPLTGNQPNLRQIANASGGVGCPATTNTTLACPLKHVAYTAPRFGGGAAPTGLETASGAVTCYLPNASYTGYSSGIPCTPTYTGTKLPNAIDVVSNAGYYAWTTANGGRNNEVNDGYAKKVLVMMTDGVNEGWPEFGPQNTVATWNTDFGTLASTLKTGVDGIAGALDVEGNNDDVEIYTVAFFCTPYHAAATTASPEKWCKSQLADTTSPHPCPGPVWPPAGVTPSAIDQLLWAASSSTPGTCDHYFPLKKTESLPAVFQTLAGNISRSQLTQ